MTLQEESPTILIVDDMPESASVLFEFLSTNNYKVFVARSGENALKMVRSSRPNLILLDVTMPGMDGFETCKRLKLDAQSKEIPIIFITDLSENIDKVRGFNLGGADFITRPFQIEEIFARISTHLTLSELQQTLKEKEAEAEQLLQRFIEIERLEELHKQQIHQIHQSYKRFVPQQFLSFLGRDSIVDVQLGDLTEKDMTVLFVDIFDFTMISEKMTPEEKFDFINIYLAQMEPIIAQYHGFVDKYIGDRIMALFPTNPNDAVNAAIAMLNELVNYNELLREAGYPTIRIGAGLNTGLLMLGTVGGKNRMDGTVISDAVSLAAKVEDLTKLYNASLLITEDTYRQLQAIERYNIRVIDRIKLKGKLESVMVYEIFNSDPPNLLELKKQTLTDFEEGCAAYHGKKFEIAQEFFAKVLELNPNDTAAMSYLERCQTPEQLEAAREKFTSELFEISKAYERFVPREFLKLLDKESVIDVQLGDHVEKEMTILFCDIRGFTAMSEKMTPQENFDFINIYLGQMEPIIGKHRGFVDKYIGDAIMALFPTSADDAVRGSIAMLRGLVEYNQLLVEANYQVIQIGIGLNTGPLMLGTVGGPNRMDGTVISDAVNLAARIEGLTKVYGSTLLITDQTYQKLEDISQYNIRVIDRVTVKGKTEAVTVYEVFDGDSPTVIELKEKTLVDFEEGCVSYHGGNLNRAKDYFEKVLSTNPHDEAAHVYLIRCNNTIN